MKAMKANNIIKIGINTGKDIVIGIQLQNPVQRGLITPKLPFWQYYTINPPRTQQNFYFVAFVMVNSKKVQYTSLVLPYLTRICYFLQSLIFSAFLPVTKHQYHIIITTYNQSKCAHKTQNTFNSRNFNIF